MGVAHSSCYKLLISYDVSGCSLKEYPKSSTKASKALVNQNLITMLQIEAIRSKTIE